MPTRTGGASCRRVNMHPHSYDLPAMTAKLDDAPATLTGAGSFAYGSGVSHSGGPGLFTRRRNGVEAELKRCNQACCANITRRKESVKCSKP